MKINIMKSVLITIIGFVSWKAFNMMVEAFNLGWQAMTFILLVLIALFAFLPGGRMALQTRYGIIGIAMIGAVIIMLYYGGV